MLIQTVTLKNEQQVDQLATQLWRAGVQARRTLRHLIKRQPTGTTSLTVVRMRRAIDEIQAALDAYTAVQDEIEAERLGLDGEDAD